MTFQLIYFVIFIVYTIYLYIAIEELHKSFTGFSIGPSVSINSSYYRYSIWFEGSVLSAAVVSLVLYDFLNWNKSWHVFRFSTYLKK